MMERSELHRLLVKATPEPARERGQMLRLRAHHFGDSTEITSEETADTIAIVEDGYPNHEAIAELIVAAVNALSVRHIPGVVAALSPQREDTGEGCTCGGGFPMTDDGHAINCPSHARYNTFVVMSAPPAPTEGVAAAERIAALESALRPFAEACRHLHPSQPDDGTTLDGFEVRDFRRAAAALSDGGDHAR